jgi:SulP family sulfate permease
MSDLPPAEPAPHFAAPFMPKLITVFREGYGWSGLKADAIAGLTVAVVALPLSMGIAIASGVSPERGLYTAIFGGFIVSLLGGSRFQIGGPAGAFIGLVAIVVERHGYDGLALATAMAGVMLVIGALARVGGIIRYIPHPVVVGFTAGIAVIIAASQVSEVLGLKIAHEPTELLPKLAALEGAIGTVNWQAFAVAIVTMAVIIVLRIARPTWPGFLIAIVAATLLAFALHLDIATVVSRFGAVPNGFPPISLPTVTLEKAMAVLPDAASFALLGAIESLLSAVVADKMGNAHHRSDGELGAQGIANIISPLFGGICVTGTIARTATNVRAGARGPMAGMLHAVYLLLFLMIAAPLIGLIPLAALGAMLLVVSWSMTDREDFSRMFLAMRGDALVLMTTFLLTIFVNLIAGIAAGCAIAALLAWRQRKAQA